jgi:hypothetical protein
MDPDPNSDADPAIFVIDFQDANKEIIAFKGFSTYYYLKAQRCQQIDNSSICRRYQKHGLPMCQHFDVDPDPVLIPRIHASD